MNTETNVCPAMPLRAFYTDVYKAFKLFKESKRAVDAYQDAINLFGKFLEREPLLSDLTTDNVAAMMHWFVKAGRAPATANARMRHLKALSRFAVRRKLANEAVDVDKYRTPKRLPEAWSVDEMHDLIQASRKAEGRICGVEACKWWPALLLLIYDTGLRRSAALGILVEEIDFRTKTLRVPAERMKNGVEQIFHLHDQTVEAILETFPPTRKLLFPWPYKGAYSKRLNRWLKSFLQDAGLKSGARDLFHKIRRTCATQIALTQGEHVAVQQLGHLSPGTIKNYIDPRFLANHQAARVMKRPGWNGDAIEVSVVSDQPITRRPVTLRSVAFFRREVSPQTSDIFAHLLGQRRLSPKDVRGVLRALQLESDELAAAAGIGKHALRRIVKRDWPVSREVAERIRVAMGITYTYNRRRTVGSEAAP